MRRQNPTRSSHHYRPPLHLDPPRCEAEFNAGASAWILAETTANSFFSILFFTSLRAFKSSSPHYSRLPHHLLYIVPFLVYSFVFIFLFIVFPLPPVHIILTFLQNFLLACTIVMFSSSFPPLSRNQLICHTDRSWGCHQLCRILFILLSIYRKSRKIRYFGCRSKDSSSSSSSSSHDSSTSLLFILDFSPPTDSFLERTLSGFFVFIQELMTHLKIN